MKNLVILCLAAIVIVATGCDGDKISNPTPQSDPSGYNTDMPYGGQTGQGPAPGFFDRMIGKATSGSSGSGNSGSGGGGSGGSGFNLPDSPGGVAMIVIAAILVLIGVYLVKEGKLRWGVPLLGGGLALVIWRIGTQGLGANFAPWNWHWIVWVLILAWTISKVTGFTKLDDWVVTGGSLVMLVLSFVGRGLLGSWNPFSSAWWILECIWVFLVAEAIWKSGYFQARRLAQVLALAAGWYVLGVLS